MIPAGSYLLGSQFALADPVRNRRRRLPGGVHPIEVAVASAAAARGRRSLGAGRRRCRRRAGGDRQSAGPGAGQAGAAAGDQANGGRGWRAALAGDAGARPSTDVDRDRSGELRTPDPSDSPLGPGRVGGRPGRPGVRAAAALTGGPLGRCLDRIADQLRERLIEVRRSAAAVGDRSPDFERQLHDLVEEAGALLGRASRQQLLERVRRDTIGLGPLEGLLADPGVDEVLVNGHDRGLGRARGPPRGAPISSSTTALSSAM